MRTPDRITYQEAGALLMAIGRQMAAHNLLPGEVLDGTRSDILATDIQAEIGPENCGPMRACLIAGITESGLIDVLSRDELARPL